MDRAGNYRLTTIIRRLSDMRKDGGKLHLAPTDLEEGQCDEPTYTQQKAGFCHELAQWQL